MCGYGLILEGNLHTIKSHNCAITYACRKLFPNCSTSLSNIYGKLYLNIGHLPDEAKKFIIEFDKTSPEDRVRIKPFEFEIELTQKAIDTININEAKEILKNINTLELI